jgi:P27 family predicted phage terminase small subunit
MKGRKATPTKLKILEGNPGKKKINKNEPQPETGIPAMPTWLEAFPAAVEEWKRESVILEAIGVMTVADAGVLAMRCYAASQIQEMALDIEREGRVVYQMKMDSLGNELQDAKTNPKATQIAKLIVEYRQLGSLLGLDPASRTKLEVTGKKPESKFQGLINAKK